jgi:recombination protein RecA
MHVLRQGKVVSEKSSLLSDVLTEQAPEPARERLSIVPDHTGFRPLVLPTQEDGARSLLDTLAPAARIVELAGGPRASRTTLAASLVVEAQMLNEPVAWIERRAGDLFPPDLAACGVDLSALIVVRVADDERSGPRAAELLLRSGAFGLVVIDYAHAATPRARATEAWLGRIAALARLHESRVLVLAAPPVTAPALGTLVSVRIETVREDTHEDEVALTYEAVRYKSHLSPPRGRFVRRPPRGFVPARAP